MNLAPIGAKIYRKNVITIQIWFGLTSLRKYFSVCSLEFSGFMKIGDVVM